MRRIELNFKFFWSYINSKKDISTIPNNMCYNGINLISMEDVVNALFFIKCHPYFKSSFGFKIKIHQGSRWYPSLYLYDRRRTHPLIFMNKLINNTTDCQKFLELVNFHAPRADSRNVCTIYLPPPRDIDQRQWKKEK